MDVISIKDSWVQNKVRKLKGIIRETNNIEEEGSMKTGQGEEGTFRW